MPRTFEYSHYAEEDLVVQYVFVETVFIQQDCNHADSVKRETRGNTRRRTNGLQATKERVQVMKTLEVFCLAEDVNQGLDIFLWKHRRDRGWWAREHGVTICSPRFECTRTPALLLAQFAPTS